MNNIVRDLTYFVLITGLMAGLVVFSLGGCKGAFEPLERNDKPDIEALKNSPGTPEARGLEAGLPGGAAPNVGTPARRPTTSARVPARLAGDRLRHDERRRPQITPAPVAAPKPAPRAIRPRPSQGPLAVVDKAMALRVEKRVPRGISDVFQVSDRAVYAFVKVKNQGPKTQLNMVWKRNGVEKWRYTLRVGKSSGWRTWSKMRLSSRRVGSWVVEVRTLDDELLDMLTFEVEAS